MRTSTAVPGQEMVNAPETLHICSTTANAPVKSAKGKPDVSTHDLISERSQQGGAFTARWSVHSKVERVKQDDKDKTVNDRVIIT